MVYGPLRATARTIKTRDVMQRARNEKGKGWVEKVKDKNKAPKQNCNEGYFKKFS